MWQRRNFSNLTEDSFTLVNAESLEFNFRARGVLHFISIECIAKHTGLIIEIHWRHANVSRMSGLPPATKQRSGQTNLSKAKSA